MVVRLERYAPHQKYYLANGQQVAGASTIAKLGDNPEGLIRWANQQGLKGVDTTKARDAAADAGTIAHFLISCHLDGLEPDLREFTEEEIAKATPRFERAKEFVEREKLVPIAVELQLVSETHEYGGTIDLVAKDENQLLTLIDWKSSKQIYPSHLRQAAGGYEMLWNENRPGQPIARRAVVLFNSSGVKPHWIPDEDAEKHKAIFRAQARLHNTIMANK